MLYGENLLEKFNPIHFTIGTDVEFTFANLGPGQPKYILMQFCRAIRQLQ